MSLISSKQDPISPQHDPNLPPICSQAPIQDAHVRLHPAAVLGQLVVGVATAAAGAATAVGEALRKGSSRRPSMLAGALVSFLLLFLILLLISMLMFVMFLLINVSDATPACCRVCFQYCVIYGI